MNLQNVRNIAIAVVVVVVGIAALGFLSTLLSSIVPIAITAVVAFILGRASASRNLLDLLNRGGKTVTAAMTAPPRPAASKPAQTTTTVNVRAADQAAERLADEKPVASDALLDPNFEIKTPEQIEEQARRLEADASKKAANPDAVAAALEERRKRLLGNKGDGG
jgi:hypothetical protein